MPRANLEAHKQYMRNYYHSYRAQPLARNLQPDIAHGATLPAGQYLACCGQWQKIDEVPMTCGDCGRIFFEETPAC
jgi:hypothetical protein